MRMNERQKSYVPGRIVTETARRINSDNQPNGCGRRRWDAGPWHTEGLGLDNIGALESIEGFAAFLQETRTITNRNFACVVRPV